MQPSVTAMLDHETAIVEITVTGSWNRQLWLQAYRCARKCLSEHPAGLLIDLTRLDDQAAGSAPLWASISAQASRMQPPVPVAICLPAETAVVNRLTQLGANRRLVVYAEPDQARAALESTRPLTDQMLLRLHPEPTAVSAARDVVTAACQEWTMQPLLARARLVTSELVTNAVEHAGTRLDLVVTRLGPLRRGTGHPLNRLRVAVYDLDPNLPTPLSPEMSARSAEGRRGLGLSIVDATVRAWGALPTPTGKVVWALLYDDEHLDSAPKRQP